MGAFKAKAKTVKRALLSAAAALLLSAPLQAGPTPTPSPSASPTALPDASKQLSVDSIAAILDNAKDFADLRTQVEKRLKDDPKDFKAHFLLGYIMQQAEGDLPRARYHLEQAHKIALKKARKGDKDAQQLYFAISYELVQVLGEMDQYQATVKLMREMAGLTRDNLDITAGMAWQLMKLNKEKAARQAIQKCLNSDDTSVKMTALNTLGALESYLGNHQAAYDAGQELLKTAALKGEEKHNLTVYYCNMGLNCFSLGRYEEAEKNFDKAAALPFSEYVISNPYAALTNLYLSQARFSETINTLTKAQRWSRAVKPFLYQQTIAGNTELKGVIYLELGMPEEAVEILNWLVQRPDRRGVNSLHVDQAEAGNLLSWRVALQANLQRNQERLAATDLKSGCLSLLRYGWQRLWHRESTLSPEAMYFGLVWNNLRMRLQISQADKRIAALSADNRRIRASMQPYFDQSISTWEWMRPNLVGILGIGLSEAAVRDIHKHPPEQYKFFKPFFTNLQGEAAFLKGQYSRSAELYRQALQGLPKQEVLLRLRTETRLAMALMKCGQESEALPLLQHVISSDGAMLREVGARLPIIPQIETAVQEPGFNQALLAGLKRSPRFKVGSSGLRLLVTSLDKENLRVTFNDAGGNSLKSFHVSLRKPQASLSETALAGIHDGLCAPNVSLSGLEDTVDSSNSSINARHLLKYR